MSLLKPNTHRRRDSTVECRVGGVYWLVQFYSNVEFLDSGCSLDSSFICKLLLVKMLFMVIQNHL